MEDQNDATERQLFDHVPDTRADRPATCPADGSYSPDDRVSQLNAEDGTTIGHAKILQVNEGDEMTFDARYFFHDSTVTYNPNPVTSILTSLAGIFSTNGLLTTLSPDQAAQFLEQTASAGSPLGNFISNAINNTGANSPDAPQAYLVYLFFDNQFNLREDKSGLLQASDPETLGDLAVQNLHADQDGFVYIYVTNESDYDVNFNNLRIAHLTSHVLEVNNYYPYGLLNKSLSWQRTPNNYKYQAKELQNDFGYNVLDFGARHYDPVLKDRPHTPLNILQKSPHFVPQRLHGLFVQFPLNPSVVFFCHTFFFKKAQHPKAAHAVYARKKSTQSYINIMNFMFITCCISVDNYCSNFT